MAFGQDSLPPLGWGSCRRSDARTAQRMMAQLAHDHGYPKKVTGQGLQAEAGGRATHWDTERTSHHQVLRERESSESGRHPKERAKRRERERERHKQELKRSSRIFCVYLPETKRLRRQLLSLLLLLFAAPPGTPPRCVPSPYPYPWLSIPACPSTQWPQQPLQEATANGQTWELISWNSTPHFTSLFSTLQTHSELSAQAIALYTHFAHLQFYNYNTLYITHLQMYMYVYTYAAAAAALRRWKITRMHGKQRVSAMRPLHATILVN